jgi:hypothetical protein
MSQVPGKKEFKKLVVYFSEHMQTVITQNIICTTARKGERDII